MIQINRLSPPKKWFCTVSHQVSGARLCDSGQTAPLYGTKVRLVETTTDRVPDLSLYAIRIAKLNPVYPELARSPLLVGSLTQDGELQLVSAGWSQALGCSMGRLAGMRLANFIDRADVQQARALFQGRSGALGGKPVSFRLIGCDGTRKRYDWHARKDRLDEVLFILGTERVPARATPQT